MVKRLIRRTPFYPAVKDLKSCLQRKHPLQRIPNDQRYALIRLGTEYGGWTFVDDRALYGSTIVSAGLGEDASFDVEFAARYRAKVIILDPTPRAIAHFEHIRRHLGSPSADSYRYSGQQPVGAYDLSSLSEENLVFDARALWKESTKLKFFEPKNPEHVSHSIINYQHDYQDDTAHIRVAAVPIGVILREYGIAPEALKLIKLDIEGAEIEVIERMLKDEIFPQQILVEFDELNIPRARAFQRVEHIHRLLEDSGYRCIHTDGKADFLYVRRFRCEETTKSLSHRQDP